jgi:predicted nucleic acid-binding protein
MTGPPEPMKPRDVYLDTSVVVAAIMAGSANSLACIAFCESIAIHGNPVAFSQTLRVELSQAIRKLATRRDRLRPDTRERFQLDRWETDVLVRRRWMSHGIERFRSLLATFAEVVELPFDSGIWERSIDLMVDHFLQSHDAVHAATATAYGLNSFATTDADFARVAQLDVILLRDEAD